MRSAFVAVSRRRPRVSHVGLQYVYQTVFETSSSSSSFVRVKSTSARGFSATSVHPGSAGLDAPPQMITITFVDPNLAPPRNRQTVHAPVGSTIVEIAKANGVDIHAACGEKLQCATCHVILPKAHHAMLGAPGVREDDLLNSAYTLTDTSRLGCQVKLSTDLDGMEVMLPRTDAKGMGTMTLDQPTPKIEKQWTAVPASVGSFKKRRAGVMAGVTQVAPDRESAMFTEARQLERDLEDQRALTSRLETELRELRAKGEMKSKKDTKSKKATNSNSDESSDADEEEEGGLAKVKAELKHTLVEVNKIGRQVGFGDVIGLELAKRTLNEALVWPAVACPSLFTGVRGTPKGVLLYGPPGCGKTMLARAAAVELGETVSFFHVRPGDVMSKFYGESQRRVQALEELVREHSPAVVFLDEVDTLLGSRDGAQVAEHHRGVTNAMLEWMDGFGTGNERVFFLGATNRAEAIDEAALRRFGEAAEVGKPCEDSRMALLSHLVFTKAAEEGHSAKLNEADLALVAKQTEGYSLADVDRLVKRAFLQVLRDMPGGVKPGMKPADVPPVTTMHFEAAIGSSQGASALRDLLKKKQEKRNKL